MFPAVSLNKKRSNSKFPAENSDSPYSDSMVRSQKSKALTWKKNKSPVISKKNLLEGNNDELKSRHIRNSLQVQFPSHIQSDITKAETLEQEYNETLKKFKMGDEDIQFINEIEIIDDILLKIVDHMKPFEKLIKRLRKRLEKNLYKISLEEIKENFDEDLEKAEKRNSSLIQKINSLSDLNDQLAEDNKKLREKLLEYDRLFKDSPNLVLNYQNIVDKMLEQCNKIKEQNHEIKKLRKYYEKYKILVKELDDDSIILSDNYKLDINISQIS